MINTFNEELQFFKVVSEEVSKHFLGSELLPYTLRLGNIKNAYGSASIEPRFEDDNKKYLDLVINPLFLQEGGNYERNIVTAIHETIHIYCRTKNIKEVSNNNRYHNKKFSELAAQCGLLTEEHKTIGCTTPGLSESMKKWIAENNKIQEAMKTLKMKALQEITSQKIKTKQSFISYTCPSCGAKVRAKRDINILCLDCDVPFIPSGE